MSLCIDARLYGRSGIGVYLQNLVPYFPEKTALLLGKQTWEKYPELHRFRPIFCTSSLYSPKEQLEIPLKVPSVDIFWTPHFNAPFFPVRAKRRLITIHDLYHLDHARALPVAQRLYAKRLYTFAIKKADQIITNSHFTTQRLLHWFPEAKEKVETIPLGPGNGLLQPAESAKRSHPYFLFVGNIKPHKNLPLLLQAFEELIEWEKNPIDLILVGQYEGLKNAFDLHEYLSRKPSLLRRVHLKQVGHQELAQLYAGATALIFPSLYEGWGFPPLEAMRLRCPVIASDAASIPEACGTAPLYFSPQDQHTLVSHMSGLLNSEEMKAKLISRGEEQAKTLSWQECGKQHQRVLSAALARP